MEKFCEYCGKRLEGEEVCNCRAEKKEIAENVMVGKSYSFVSSSFMCMSLIPYQGKIFTDIDVDEEKMNIKITPKRRNKISTVYFKDIKEVNVSVKLSIYLVIIAVICAILGFVEPPCFLVAFFWLWIAVNRKVMIILGNGECIDVYSNAKGPAEAFANELRQIID